jgi:hypothetical protein
MTPRVISREEGLGNDNVDRAGTGPEVRGRSTHSNSTKLEGLHGKITDQSPGEGGAFALRKHPTLDSTSSPSSTPRRSSTICSLPLSLSESLLSLVFAGEKKPENPAQIRRLLHRRSSWVLAAAPREISPPPSVSGPKIRAFPLPAFVFPAVLICCFLGSPWMERVMPVAEPAAPRSVLVSEVVAGFAPVPTAWRCSSG